MPKKTHDFIWNPKSVCFEISEIIHMDSIKLFIEKFLWVIGWINFGWILGAIHIKMSLKKLKKKMLYKFLYGFMKKILNYYYFFCRILCKNFWKIARVTIFKIFLQKSVKKTFEYNLIKKTERIWWKQFGMDPWSRLQKIFQKKFAEEFIGRIFYAFSRAIWVKNTWESLEWSLYSLWRWSLLDSRWNCESLPIFIVTKN